MYNLLDGIRVLDLTRVWSGPLAGRILADLGAEVIQIVGRITVSGVKITPEQAAVLGTFPDDGPGERPWDRMSHNNDFSRNKLGITLELNTPEGIDLFKRLVAKSDVVLENFSPRVMPNFGLNYAVLKEIKPSIIMCSMPGFGLTGPQKDYVSYGVNLDFSSGLASLMGYPDGGAHMSGNAYPDVVAALHAVGAVLTALFHKMRTGVGQHIDLSQAESATSVIGEAALGFALHGNVPLRRGNRHPVYAPQGCYRCRGKDKWVTIAISTESQWEALAGIPGMPAQMKDAKYGNTEKRQAHHDELDEMIQSWALTKTHRDAMRMLQNAGIPAGAVLDAADMLADEHLCKRDFFLEQDHSEVGLRKYCNLPIRFSGIPFSPGRPSPLLGQHNDFVLSKILGLSPEEITRLEQNGIIGTEPMDE